jgi:hypothetical protein
VPPGWRREHEFSRRALRGGGGGASVAAAGASVVAAGGCGGSPAPPGYGFNQSIAQADGDTLNALLDLEYVWANAYRSMLGLLSPARRPLGERLAEQESAHAGALLAELERLGITPHRSPRRFRLPPLRREADALRYAVHIENVSVAAYIDALPKLGRPSPRSTVASILTTESEHLAVLGRLAGLPALSEAFVWGHS